MAKRSSSTAPYISKMRSLSKSVSKRNAKIASAKSGKTAIRKKTA